MIGMVFALALAALALALSVLLPFSVWKDLKRFEAERGSAALAAKIEALGFRIDALKQSHTRNIGSIWKTIGRAGLRQNDGDAQPEVIETTRTANGDFEALLELQSKPAVKP